MSKPNTRLTDCATGIRRNHEPENGISGEGCKEAVSEERVSEIFWVLVVKSDLSEAQAPPR